MWRVLNNSRSKSLRNPTERESGRLPAARGNANLNMTRRCNAGRFENCGPPGSARPPNKDPSSSDVRDRGNYKGLRIIVQCACKRRAFAFGSMRDIQVEGGARILDSHSVTHCSKWDTAGKTVAIDFGEPVVNLREALLDDAIPPIEMGGWETERRQ